VLTAQRKKRPALNFVVQINKCKEEMCGLFNKEFMESERSIIPKSSHSDW
jgi:hypothetical protein